jgi:hypothetical protein
VDSFELALDNRGERNVVTPGSECRIGECEEGEERAKYTVQYCIP